MKDKIRDRKKDMKYGKVRLPKEKIKKYKIEIENKTEESRNETGNIIQPFLLSSFSFVIFSHISPPPRSNKGGIYG